MKPELGESKEMLSKEEKVSVLSESERMKLGERAVEAIMGQSRRKNGAVRRTRRD